MRYSKVGNLLPNKFIGIFFISISLAGCGSGGDDTPVESAPVIASDPELPIESDPALPGETDPASPGETDPVPPGEAGLDLSGLDSRPGNSSCFVPNRPSSLSGVTIDEPFPSLKLGGLAITNIFQKSNDGSYWYLVSRLGTLYRFENRPDVSRLEPVLDLTDRVSTYYGELGLLNAVFHPDFPVDPRVFVYYSGTEDVGNIHLSSFTSSDGGATFDPDSEQEIISLPQFQKFHKGGGLQFDEEGYLYLSIGDGGDKVKAQDPFSLYGTLIKIDINSGAPYQIPPDNPFVLNGVGAPEVFAYGLRNPWRFSIDSVTKEILLADVGGGTWEEINLVEPGKNYGWPIREGAHCRNAPDDQCDSTGLSDPLFEYGHNVGASIIGGFVYRGSAIPSLIGKYIYGDYRSGVVWALEKNGTTVIANEELVSNFSFMTSFAQDNNGEIFVVRPWQIRRLVPAKNTNVGQSVPQFLSATGCFSQNDPKIPLDGLIPYEVNAEYWSDGAEKRRWMALPDGQFVDVNDEGDFLFPIGTVLIKEFSLDSKRLETRFLFRYEDGKWGGYSYLWNDDESDAELLRKGTDLSISDQTYTIPNERQCTVCHTDAANIALGPELSQLNREMLYPTTGKRANQLTTLEHIGLLSKALPDRPNTLPKLSRIDDESQSTDEKVRSYLHVNCSQCHRPGGIVDRSTADFRYKVTKGMGVCGLDPQIFTLGISGAKLIAPGDPDRSIVMARIKNEGGNQMPPIARNVLHTQAISLLEEFITNLESCD